MTGTLVEVEYAGELAVDEGEAVSLLIVLISTRVPVFRPHPASVTHYAVIPLR